VFSVERDAPFLDPALLRWKYWEPRGDCPDPRSLVLERNGAIVAHAGLWPVTVRNGMTSERGIHMIDWASDPATPGAGVGVLQRLIKEYDFVYSIGGSDMTQTILPKFGFRRVGDTLSWARPIRPWRQMVQHQTKDFRIPLRLARNLWWSKWPVPAMERGWMIRAASGDGGEGLAALGRERCGAFFRYLKQCPGARCLTFTIENDSRKEGFLAMSIVREQARIAGVWLEEPSPSNWRLAFHLAQELARKTTDTSELIASCVTEESAAGAELAGMRLRARTPVYLFRKSWVEGTLPLGFQVCDNDSVFLRERTASFLT
jgi:hypothetical protein